MPQILVQELSKSYLVSEREAGAWGAVKGLIRRRRRVIEALKGISFSLERGELLGLHRTQRRRQIDDYQNSLRHPEAVVRTLRSARLRSVA